MTLDLSVWQEVVLDPCRELESMCREAAREVDTTEPLRAQLAEVSLNAWIARQVVAGAREHGSCASDADACAFVASHDALTRMLSAADEIAQARHALAPEAARRLSDAAARIQAEVASFARAAGGTLTHRRRIGVGALELGAPREDAAVDPFVRELLRVCDTAIAPRAARHDAESGVSDDAWSAVRDARYASVFFSPSLGGLGGSAQQALTAMDALATACVGTYWQATASALLYGKCVASLVSAPQRAKWLAPVIAGDALGSFALAEAGSTADLGSIRAVVRKHGSGYRLTGTKQPITNAMKASLAVVLARREESSRDAPLCFVLVDLRRPGVTRRALPGTGLRSATWGVLSFKDYEVGADEVFEASPEIVLAATAWGQFSIAMGAIGIARRALAAAVLHLRARAVFDGTLADVASVQEQIGGLTAAVFAARVLAEQAACGADGLPNAPAAWRAKVYATEVAQHVSTRCLHLQGARGLVAGSVPERCQRDAAMFIHAGMSNDRLRDILANVALDKAPFSSPLQAVSPVTKGPYRVAKKILITGSTGFIGGHLAARLAARGDHVRALVRKTSKVDNLVKLGIELAYGDLTDAESLAAACQGMDHVIHNAAPVGTFGEWEHFLEEGVRGTERLLQGAIQAGTRRFIFMSSIAAYGFRPHGRPLREDTPFDRAPQPWNHYVREKVMCEDALWAAHERGDIVLTSIRPSAVFGPGDRNIVPRMIGLLSFPVLVLPGKPENRVPCVTIHDLVDATIRAIDDDVSHGRAYNISGAAPITQQEAFDLVASAAKLEAPRLNLPTNMLFAPVGALEWAWAGMKRPGEPPATRGAIALFGYDYEIDISRAMKELGFKGDSSYSESILASVA